MALLYNKLKLLLVDDHLIIRQGLKAVLSALRTGYEFEISEASTGEEGVQKAAAIDYDIIFLDYNLPVMKGHEVVRALIDLKPWIKIIGLSVFKDHQSICNMLDAGAKGYVLKNIEPYQLVEAIETVLAGNRYFSNEVALTLIDGGTDKFSSKVESEILSHREKEVLQLIAKEFNSDEISQKLVISKRTVEAHRQNISRKLQVKNTVGLVKYAYLFNLV